MRRRAGLVVVASSPLRALVASSVLARQIKEGASSIRPEIAAHQAAAKELQRAIIERRSSGRKSADFFGTQCCQILHIPAAAFTSVDGAVPLSDGDTGYMYPSSFGGQYDFSQASRAAARLPRRFSVPTRA